MKKGSVFRVMMIALVLLILVIAIPQAVLGQPQPERDAPPPIREDDRPAKIWPWLFGGALSVATVFTGIKNAKRSHLD